MITLASTTYTVDLPNPTFGDTEAREGRLVVRRSLSNKQRTYVSTSDESIFRMTIPNMTIQNKLDLEAVLSECDELITYTDPDAVDWIGYITNFPFDVVEIMSRARTEACITALEEIEPAQEAGATERRYSVTINFRGKLV